MKESSKKRCVIAEFILQDTAIKFGLFTWRPGSKFQFTSPQQWILLPKARANWANIYHENRKIQRRANYFQTNPGIILELKVLTTAQLLSKLDFPGQGMEN